MREFSDIDDPRVTFARSDRDQFVKMRLDSHARVQRHWWSAHHICVQRHWWSAHHICVQRHWWSAHQILCAAIVINLLRWVVCYFHARSICWSAHQFCAQRNLLLLTQMFLYSSHHQAQRSLGQISFNHSDQAHTHSLIHSPTCSILSLSSITDYLDHGFNCKHCILFNLQMPWM